MDSERIAQLRKKVGETDEEFIDRFDLTDEEFRTWKMMNEHLA